MNNLGSPLSLELKALNQTLPSEVEENFLRRNIKPVLLGGGVLLLGALGMVMLFIKD